MAFAAGSGFSLAAADRTDPDFPQAGVPFLQQHCLACHSGPKPKADLSLAAFRDDASVLKNHKLWDNVIGMVETGGMPPEDRPQPAAEQREAFLRAVRGVFERAARDAKPDPGRVTMRRLNRTEYRNTIRDLVGVGFDPAADFPSDDIGHGFDNIGDVLTMSPVLMERYLAAAENIVQRTFQGPPDSRPARQRGLLACAADKPQADQTREILRCFASRAYRRPATTDEVERLAKLAESALAAGQSWEGNLQLAMQAVLCSPKFLFRAELDDRPDSLEVRPLDEYQLASRLSYFLWSTMPDEELSRLAEKNQLRASLDAQVRRMLQDPKSEALVENFALQWLQLKRLEEELQRLREASEVGPTQLARTPGFQLDRAILDEHVLKVAAEEGAERARLRRPTRSRRHSARSERRGASDQERGRPGTLRFPLFVVFQPVGFMLPASAGPES